MKSVSLKTLGITLLSASALTLAACGGPQKSAPAQTTEAPVEAQAATTLTDVIAHPRRSKDQARDQFRNPKETLEFFGVAPGKTVAEIWPGWYTDIIAPYLADNDGTYVAVLNETGISERLDDRVAAYKDKYSDSDVYGTVEYGALGASTPQIAAPGSVDIVLTFRNTHSFLRNDLAEKAFSASYAALKPGGTLGVVQHRLPESALQSPKADTGYVQESFIKSLAADAGFEFVASSEVNANPRDTADHPFGVWTLPPRSFQPQDDDPKKEGFDAALYKNIGESDRATLKFRKPL